MKIIIIFLTLYTISACQGVRQTQANDNNLSQKPIVTTTPTPVQDAVTHKLSWNKPQWDILLLNNIKENSKILLKATDLPGFYDSINPKFADLTDDQKIVLVAELLIQVMKYESNWDPTCYYIESTMGIDPITKRQVASEGLFQLSYQDQKNYLKYFDCGFNWNIDKAYGNKDLRKTIFDPVKNISCGVKILSRQVQSYGAISISKGAYWSTLKIGSSHSKIDKIKVSLKGLKL